MLPEDEKIPWSGHSGRWAAEKVMREIERHKTTLGLLQHAQPRRIDLPGSVGGQRREPADRHPPRLAVDRGAAQGRGGDGVGRLRALVCTASLDLGVDWGDVDLVIQMGAPKGSSRLLQRIGRANHRLDEPSEAILVPGNRFEYLEARAALDAIDDGELDPEVFRPGALDVLAQHVMACACAAPFGEARCSTRCAARRLMRACPKSCSDKSSPSSRMAAMRCAPMTSSSG